MTSPLSRLRFYSLLPVVLLSGLLSMASAQTDSPELKRLELNPSRVSMAPGEQQMLRFDAITLAGETLKIDDFSKEELRLLSLNPDVATVNSAGKVFARETGAATIQVDVESNGLTLTAQTRVGVSDRPLSESDFVLDGPYGSYGSAVEKLGENHFLFRRGGHPEEPDRSSLPQFFIPEHFKGNGLTLDIAPLGPVHPGHNYYLAFSFDGENWSPIRHRVIGEDPSVSRIEIPPTNSDSLYLGFQIPLSHETAQRFIKNWASDPRTSRYITLHEIGHSIQGRPLYRMEVSDPDSPHPRADRWVHYISQAHPHEGKSRWRVKGMIDWVLSDEGADARNRHIWHFVLTMNPDGVNNGFTRVNAEGIDMNRTYRMAGAERSEQAHEAFLYQRDIEEMMASDTPITTFWDMHVWPQRVDPMMLSGPEFGEGENFLGEWSDLRDLIENHDPDDLIQPLTQRRFEGNATLWDRGVHRQFEITSSLVEGSGWVDTQEENVEAGRILARSIDAFYTGTQKGLISPGISAGKD